jgi:CheY-like chemotaxis protein
MGRSSYWYAWTRPFTRGAISGREFIVKLQREAEHRRILIVDDEEGFRDGLADLLGMEGYAVSVARDAVEAVRLLPEIKPDVILLDLRMPHLDGEAFLRGMGGLQASRKVPVALMSAKEDLPAIAGRTGAAGYLSKPFEAPQLLSLLEQVLP